MKVFVITESTLNGDLFVQVYSNKVLALEIGAKNFKDDLKDCDGDLSLSDLNETFLKFYRDMDRFGAYFCGLTESNYYLNERDVIVELTVNKNLTVNIS